MFGIRFPGWGDEESRDDRSPKERRRSTRAHLRSASTPNFHQLAIEALETRSVFSAAPQLVSLLGTNPEGLITTASTVSYQAVFSEDVTGVDATDFQLLRTSAFGSASLQITPVSGSVYTITIGPLNGSGKVALNFVDDGTIKDLEGNGLDRQPLDFVLRSQQTFSVGTNPRSIATADLNEDGKLDIVAANQTDGTVSVLLGVGDGTFTAQQTFVVGASPTSHVIADLNGDDHLDIAVANGGAGTISVLLGNGDGTFQTQQTLAVGTNMKWLTGGDFNRDGRFDLAITSSGVGSTAAILIGNGDGTFQAALTYSTPDYANSIVVGDLNADGKADLVVSSQYAG